MTDYINAIEQGIDFTRFRNGNIGENTIDDAIAVIETIKRNGVGITFDVCEGLEHISAIIKNAKNDSFFDHLEAFKGFKKRYRMGETDTRTIDRVSNRFYSEELYGLDWPFMPKIDRNGVRHLVGEELQKFRDIALAHGFKVAKERYDLNQFSYILARKHMTDAEIRQATKATPKKRLYTLYFAGLMRVDGVHYYHFSGGRCRGYFFKVESNEKTAFSGAHKGDKYEVNAIKCGEQWYDGVDCDVLTLAARGRI